MRKRVIVVADVDSSFLDAVTADERFAVETRLSPSEAELIESVSDAHVIVSRAFSPITAAVIHAASRLELILQGTSGLDNIDAAEAERRGVRVVTTPGANANAVAELVLGLMLTLTRTVTTYDEAMKQGDWTRSDCASRHELRAHSVGIVGIGRVGASVAHLLQAFGCQARAFDPYVDTEQVQERGAHKLDRLADLLAGSDILTLHVPLTTETRGMIGAEELAMLPEHAIVINTSRGEVVDAAALLDSFRSGHLGGAALDVFDPEPPTRDWPSDRRLILTPHIAGCTAEAKLEAGTRMYRELCNFYGFEPIEPLAGN